MNDHLNSVTGTPHVTMPGPGGSTNILTQEQKDMLQRRGNIISITPDGEDPVLYWHQVAQDAIKSAESARNQAKQAREERAKTQRAFDNLTARIARKNEEYRMQVEKDKSEVPFDLSRLVGMAGQGDIDLNVTVQIKGKRRMPLYEHEEDD